MIGLYNNDICKIHGTPWQRFMEFISPTADRFTILKELLDASALDYRIIGMAGMNHFIVSPPGRQVQGRHAPSMLVAHYDRAEGSQGANDNSAGVFLMIDTAARLIKKGARNWVIVFTDKEEIKTGGKIQTQGSYVLAERIKNTIMEKSKIFCFDTCGAGDTLIVSTTLEHLLRKDGAGEKLRKSVLELRKSAMDTARNLRMKKVLLAPTPFSDDLGFFKAGLAAQTITMLPSEECTQLVSELSKNQEFADVLISAEQRKNTRSNSIPETWRGLNSSLDSYLRLTPKHFRTVVDFATALCER